MESIFKQRLREISNQINIPEPEKSKLLLEIACDMEIAYRELIDSGIDKNEAQEKVCQNFNFTDEEVSNLREVYLTPWQRIKMKIGNSMSSKLYGTMLGFLIIVVFALSGSKFLNGNFFAINNLHGMLSFICLVVASISFVSKLFQLYVRRDFEINRLKANTGLLEICGIATVISAVIILCEKLSALSGNLALIFKPLLSIADEGSGDLESYRALAQTGIELSLLEINVIMIFILIFCMWFIINTQIGKMQKAALDLMLQYNN